ncbi:rho GTPase-activating protein 7-like isoform X3 [Pelodiscus sinensis]|uniref:rho GTPase-activating protein 7-like isoform X3 n=1 Tax=Pelodiscus sinensis TaxID=13735 RepID=UPI000703FEF0|nr:rho GTPase-activating protein 7-like isoform X2 [Pelodiscus sinensis]|eukprot:XP_014425341.1 rho GTPase-activating protein 7-like isoform X2 [Pelodiscus sinensis]
MAYPGKSRLRRSFSEHIKDSTNKAWDVFWKSTREKRLSEIEAKEACDWLKAAGFPQYAQLFEDMQFPIDIKTVRKDHEFLDRDAIDSLYRRLNTLNKCAAMKVEISRQRKRSDESEDEEPCAISNKWAYERCSQRWSRLESVEGFPLKGPNSSVPDSPRHKSTGSEEISFSDQGEKHDASSIHSSTSGDSDIISFPKTFEDVETSTSSSRCSSSKLVSPDSTFSCSPSPSDFLNIISEEQLLDKPPHKKGKSFLKKMEKLRIRSSSVKRDARSKAKPIIGEPVLVEGLNEEKLKNLNCVDICDLSGSQIKKDSSYSPPTCSSSSQSENSSTVSTPSPVIKVRSYAKRGGVHAEDTDSSKLSLWNDVSEQNFRNEINLHANQMFHIPQGHKPGTFPKALTNSFLSPTDNSSVNWRTGSFHGCRRNRIRISAKESETPLSPLSCIDNRLSIYDNVPSIPVHLNKMEVPDVGDDDVFSELDNVMEHINGLRKLVNQWTEKFSDDGDSDFANDSTSPCPSSPKEIHLEIKQHSADKLADLPAADGKQNCNELDSPELIYVGDSEMASSFSHSNRHERRHWSTEETVNFESPSVQIDNQSAAHLNRIQKLALLKLTALMDKYSPSSKQGWNWTVPKFIRKIKTPDYKDKSVFGVPLLLNVQRTSYPLPKSILQAMQYLRSHFLDQVGLFRKSGVKSRILSLREMNENDPNNVTYEGQSAFDVADMVKQYFRDLPEPIFTSKLCESFLHIYQYLPKDQQFHAVQAAILLLPDENREALKILLFFLRDVVAFVEENQMTPTNIAVCLAPSLFHLNTLRRESSSSSRSSQRKYSLGKPDQRDLSENLAATQGLAHMIMECSRLFQMPDYCLDQCGDDLYEQNGLCEKATLTASVGHSMLISLENAMQDLLRDAKEKFKSWVTCPNLERVEVANKKVEDNYHVRLWKASTEIEVGPKVILQRILTEQHLWDPSLQQAKILETWDEETDVYHYTTEGMSPILPREYVVLRTWRTDPQNGTCILAATSIDSEGATLHGILAHVLLCQYLIEPVGSQKCKVTHVCRTDMRGRTTEWYNRVFGHMCAAELMRIKDSFKPLSAGTKETKI